MTKTGAETADKRLTGVRTPYAEMPTMVRSWVDEQLGGPVETVIARTGGMSPAVAATVVTRSGERAFVKAVSADINPDTPTHFRHEITVLSTIGPAPYRADASVQTETSETAGADHGDHQPDAETSGEDEPGEGDHVQPQEVRAVADHHRFPHPPLAVHGHEALDARVSRAHEMFVAAGEHSFVARGEPSRPLRHVLVLPWALVSTADGTPSGRGINVLDLDDDGRIRLDHLYVER